MSCLRSRFQRRARCGREWLASGVAAGVQGARRPLQSDRPRDEWPGRGGHLWCLQGLGGDWGSEPGSKEQSGEGLPAAETSTPEAQGLTQQKLVYPPGHTSDVGQQGSSTDPSRLESQTDGS